MNAIAISDVGWALPTNFSCTTRGAVPTLLVSIHPTTQDGARLSSQAHEDSSDSWERRMGTSTTNVAMADTVNTVMSWDGHSRADLAYRLLLSLEDTTDEEAALSPAELERLWSDEAARRLADFDAGRVGSVGRDEAMRQARAELAR